MARPKRKPENLLGGEPLEAFGSVNVLRHEETGTRLLGVVAPRELEERAQFVARFGGGSYTLVARSPDNRRIARRFPLALEGAPKPAPDAPLAKPTGRRATEPGGVPRPFATPEGLLARAVFACFRAGRSTEEIVDELGIAPSVVRALFREWVTDHKEDPPASRAELDERVKARRARQRERWNDELERT